MDHRAPVASPCFLGRGPASDRDRCAATTCVHGLAHVASHGGMRHCNSGPARGTRSALARSSQAGHKKAGKKSCCVTTRERLVLMGSAPDQRMCLLLDSGIPHGGVLFAPAERPRVAAELRGERVVVAAAWRPASGAGGGDIRGPGSISGYSDLAGIRDCIPCAGRCGDAIGKDSRRN